MTEENTFEGYIKFVERVIKLAEKLGGLASGDQVTPENVNYALAHWYEISLGLCSEYERVKNEHFDLENKFEQWYDSMFELAKAEVIAEYEGTKIKPSLKEIEVRTRTKNRVEYYERYACLHTAEMKTRTYLRLMDTVDRYDKILTTLSQNMRAEMSVLTLSNRVNADPLANKIRADFPDESTINQRRATRSTS